MSAAGAGSSTTRWGGIPWKLLWQGARPAPVQPVGARRPRGGAGPPDRWERPDDPFAWWLLGLSVTHHLLAYTCLARLYVQSVPRTRHVVWYPVAGIVLNVILYRAIRMCWTGKVTWRGTAYTEKTVPDL